MPLPRETEADQCIDIEGTYPSQGTPSRQNAPVTMKEGVAATLTELHMPLQQVPQPSYPYSQLVGGGVAAALIELDMPLPQVPQPSYPYSRETEISQGTPSRQNAIEELERASAAFMSLCESVIMREPLDREEKEAEEKKEEEPLVDPNLSGHGYVCY